MSDEQAILEAARIWIGGRTYALKVSRAIDAMRFQADKAKRSGAELNQDELLAIVRAQFAQRARTDRDDRKLAAERRMRVRTQTQEDRVLAQKLINIGYKELARELHPDSGGSGDAMARLNQVWGRITA